MRVWTRWRGLAVGHVGAAVGQVLGDPDGEGSVFADAAGDGLGGGHEGVGGHYLAHEADAEGLFSVDEVAGEEEFHGVGPCRLSWGDAWRHSRGGGPTGARGQPKEAVSEAILMSQAMASSRPPARQ